MNQVLENYIRIVPVIKDALGLDIMMSVTDGNEFLAYWKGDKMVADIHVGDILSHDDPMWTSFTTGRKLEQICPADVYGFAFKAITIAIKDGQEIVGTMGIAISLENETYTKEASARLLETISRVQDDMETITGCNETIKESSEDIKRSAADILKDVENVGKFVNDIQTISNKTNILALNASIEAARAGDAGRGFAVVANEMGNLASGTKQSSQQILDILERLSNDIAEMKKDLELQDKTQIAQAETSQKLFEEVRSIEDVSRHVLEKFG